MKKILLILLILLCFMVAWYAPLIRYGVGQGIGQLKIIWQARPIAEVLDDPNFPDTLKIKLRVVGDVRAFATDIIGLKDTENYTTVFNQKGKDVMWVVTACEPFALRAKIWTFPVLGKVPYKGFFDQQQAQKEVDNLKKEGWEISMRSPSGWSTLGWFVDPILSSMLMRSEGRLASLIIHEMVHATLFVKDSVTYNENLASFIADSTAYDFLARKYGIGSAQYKAYALEMDDRRSHNDHMLRGVKMLDSLYKTFTNNMSIMTKKDKKETLIHEIITSMDTLSSPTLQQLIRRLKISPPNNDYFMTYMRYGSKKKHFKEDLQQKYGGDFNKMIRDYTDSYLSL